MSETMSMLNEVDLVPNGGESAERYSMRAVDRAARVLGILAASERPLTLSAIASAADLSVATTLRLLRALHNHDLVQTDVKGDRYLLGFGILHLSQALLRHLDIGEVARPFITAVRDECNETTGVAIRTGDYWTHVLEVQAVQPLRHISNLGQRLPLYAGSTGKVFLAALADPEIDAYLQRTPLIRFSDTTPSTPEALREQINRVRAQGYAESHNERGEGGAAVAAPIYNHEGIVIAALKISGPAPRFTGERLAMYIAAVLRASRQLSEALGYRGGTKPSKR